MQLRTPLCDLLGAEYPVVQAPVGSVTCPALAAAVTEAGGLGTLAVSWRSERGTRDAVAETRALTDGPVAANVVVDEATGVAPAADQVETVLEAGVDVVSLSFGLDADLVARCVEAGARTLVSVGAAAAAERAVEAGADAVVAQGWEAGGHLQSEVATSVLVPRVADAVDVPVVAAGGVGDGRGLAAALALGAAGGWLGTRFVATVEADAHPAYKRALADAAATDTVRTELFDGGWPDRPHRTLVNDTVRRWERAGRPATDRPGEGETVARLADGTAVRRYDDVPPLSGAAGEVTDLPLYAGQSAGLVAGVEPAGAVVDELVAATLETVAGLPGGE